MSDRPNFKQEHGPLWQLKANRESKRLLVTSHMAEAEKYTKAAEKARLEMLEYEAAINILESKDHG